MRIETYQGHAGAPSEHAEPERRVSLKLLLRQPTDKQRRPCPGCDAPCSCSKRSTDCCCGCSPACANAPLQLTSDPDRFPIEPGVLPLVYAMTTLRVVETCWSCEGHADGDAIAKFPQVWFYSASTVFPELIAQHAQDMLTRRQLSHAWYVSVSPFSACDVTTFTLRPAPSQSSRLGDLRRDLALLAGDLVPGVRMLATRALENAAKRA